MHTLGDNSLDETCATAQNANACAVPHSGRRRAGLQVRGAAGSLSVVSDLTSTEPVTEQEIALVLTLLGDKIANIIES